MSVIVLALCIVMITLSGCDVAKNRCPGNVRNVAAGFADPQDSTRTKVWWFHGETETTREGITADLEAYRRAGVGGVVYYDQVHNKKTPGAFEAMSSEWWDMLIFFGSRSRAVGAYLRVPCVERLCGRWPVGYSRYGNAETCIDRYFGRRRPSGGVEITAPEILLL